MGESLSSSSTNVRERFLVVQSNPDLERQQSDSKYTPYAVHVFPGGISVSDTPALTPVQVDSLSSDDLFSSCGTVGDFAKKKEINSSVASHSHPSKGISHWDIHPSLRTLLGDLCSNHDMNEAVNNSRIEGFPSKEFDEEEEDTDCALSSALSHRLSIGAPEFVPSFLNPKHPLSPSFGPDLGLDPDPYLALAPSEIVKVEITQSPSSTLADKNDQCLRNKLNLMSDSVSRSRPQDYPLGKNIIENDLSSCTTTEERNLISFDGDFPLISERSTTPRHHPTDQHPFSSQDEQSYTAAYSFEESFLPGREEYAKENQFVSFEQNAHFEAPSLSQLTLTDHDSENKNESFHDAPEDVVSSGVQSYRQQEETKYQVYAETRQPRYDIPSGRPLFKTYAEATNFYYSLLEGESREKLFQDSLRPQTPPTQPPGLTHPSLMHTSDRPNWAAAPDEDMNSSIQFNEHSRCSDRFINSSVSTRPNENFAGESLVDIQGDNVARAPRSLDGNDHIESGTNHFSDANGSYHSRRDTGTHSPYALSDDRGDRNGKSYPDKKGFSSRGSNPTYGSDNLEREIDEYHENLRAKANRSSHQAQQSGRARNGNGSSNLRSVGHYDDLEREIDGYHDNLRAKANRSSQQAQLGSGRASARNGGGNGGSGNGTASSSDNGKRGRDLSRRSLRGSGEEWVNNANWAQTENENEKESGGWGCE